MGKKVLTVGVFDIFHYGHLKLFENAKKFGDYLIVAIQDSDYILKYKIDAKVFYSTEQRLEMIKALRIVDDVVIYKDVDKIITEVNFDVFVKGEDQTHAGFQLAVNFCKQNNKELFVLPRTKNISSTSIKETLK